MAREGIVIAALRKFVADFATGVAWGLGGYIGWAAGAALLGLGLL